MALRLDFKFSPALRVVQRGVLALLARAYQPYQPISLSGFGQRPGERSCNDRWELIAPVLSRHRIGTLIDLGCAEGFFVRRSATLAGCLALGIDADIRRLTVAQTASALDETHDAGFMRARITPDFIDRLPEFDAVLFLSVLHHIMAEHGEAYARDLMQRIRRKTKTLLIFDMGQSDESTQAWSGQLPAMGPAPHLWIAAFLRSAGFTAVEKMGEVDGYQGAGRRTLFLLRP
jgi:hypothetical protein